MRSYKRDSVTSFNSSEEYSSLEFYYDRFISKIRSKKIKNSTDIDLSSGIIGNSIYILNLYLDKKEEKYLNDLYFCLDVIIDNFHLLKQPSLFQGFTGAGWLFKHILNQREINLDHIDGLDQIDELIEKSSSIYFRHKYYSLMYGFIGIGIYYLECLSASKDSKSIKYEQRLEEIVYLLDDISIKKHDEIYWLDYTSIDFHKIPDNIINLGIPHGIAGIVLFLVKVREHGIAVEKTTELIHGSILWLSRNSITTDYGISYPSLIQFGVKPIITRINWAYGDLCTIYSIYKSGLNQSDNTLENLCNELFITLKNRGIENSLIHFNNKIDSYNLGICKGIAGNLLLLDSIKKLKTNNILVNECYDYWLNLFINEIDKRSEKDFFKIFTVTKSEKVIWKNQYNFLEGYSGIGLTAKVLKGTTSEWKNLILI